MDLIKKNYLPLNLEMAATSQMQEFCLKVLPSSCCIVQRERRTYN